MKVLLINKFLFPKGGAETYTFDVGKMLEEHGHEVQFFGLENEKNTVLNVCTAFLMIIVIYVTAPMLIKFTPTSLITWFVYAICVGIYSLVFICIFHIIFARDNFRTILLRLRNMKG